jgi:hypothetical protein
MTIGLEGLVTNLRIFWKPNLTRLTALSIQLFSIADLDLVVKENTVRRISTTPAFYWKMFMSANL